MAEFITSDHHFCHTNVLEFEERQNEFGVPFSSIHEMHAAMIANWNAVVNKNDTVYYVGDFCFGGLEEWRHYLNELRGNIIFIKGNHDKSKIVNRMLTEGLISELHTLGTAIRRDKLVLNIAHYPMLIGARPRNFSVHGHLHSYTTGYTNHINIGVDSPFAKELGKPFGTPITMDELVIKAKELNPLLIEEKEEIARKYHKSEEEN